MEVRIECLVYKVMNADCAKGVLSCYHIYLWE